ncbi:hypothetical protein EVAR_11660_1 [Eumeta japonica]|uniref:Uncharacterized protein n=1 Tax=Eumeta variegata TaxID=151549 RepID=A0A4C1U4E4_EUMVA|nr:hypothetical protein EVAR_11660_1 [Eumeta japonica]
MDDMFTTHLNRKAVPFSSNVTWSDVNINARPDMGPNRTVKYAYVRRAGATAAPPPTPGSRPKLRGPDVGSPPSFLFVRCKHIRIHKQVFARRHPARICRSNIFHERAHVLNIIDRI